MYFSHLMPSRLFIIFSTVTNCFFSFSSYFLHLPHLFIFSLTLQFLFILYKNLSLSLISSSLAIWTLILSQTLSSSPMSPKAKKTSYMITGKVFNLTCQVGATRLMESPPLIHRPQNHLSEDMRTELVSFSNFSHFRVLLWSSVLIYFWTCKCLSFVVGWV